MFYLYTYEHKINGKIYIGQTNNIKKRHSEHSRNQDNTYFHNAIQKDSIDMFYLTIINIVDTKEEIDQEEIYWIARMRECLGREHVYNLTDGGEGSMGCIPSKETRQKLSKASKGKPKSEKHKQNMKKLTLEQELNIAADPRVLKDIAKDYGVGKETIRITKQKINKDKPQSLEHMRIISESHMGKNLGELNGFFGKRHTEESIQKMSKATKGKQLGESNPSAKLTNIQRLAIQMDDRIAKEIAKDYSVNASTINRIKKKPSYVTG